MAQRRFLELSEAETAGREQVVELFDAGVTVIVLGAPNGGTSDRQVFCRGERASRSITSILRAVQRDTEIELYD